MRQTSPRSLPGRSLLYAGILAIGLTGCESLSGGPTPIRELSAEPGRRLGDLDDPTIGFTRIVGVEVDPDGNLIVLEAAVPEIRVYAPDGTLLRRIGRRGPGPGEFEQPSNFGLVGDTIWVTETFPGRRLTLYDRSGDLIAATTFSPVTVLLPELHGLVVPHALRPDGSFSSSLGVVQGSRDQPPTGVEADDSIPVPIVRFDSRGSVIDTIGWMDRPPPRMWRRPQEDDSDYRTIDFNGRRITVPTPMTTLPHWEPVDNGFIEVDVDYATSADDAEFHVRRIGLAHDTIYDRAIPYVPEPYTSEDLNALAEGAAKGGNQGFVIGALARATPDDWQQALPRVLDAMDFPEFKLPVQYSWLSQDESLWIRFTDSGPDVARWLILDREGRPKGRLQLPARARVVWNRDDTFWAVVPDELDVQWLVEHRIEGL